MYLYFYLQKIFANTFLYDSFTFKIRFTFTTRSLIHSFTFYTYSHLHPHYDDHLSLLSLYITPTPPLSSLTFPFNRFRSESMSTNSYCSPCERGGTKRRRESVGDASGNSPTPNTTTSNLNISSSLNMSAHMNSSFNTSRAIATTTTTTRSAWDIPSSEWTPELSNQLYGVSSWGQPFFGVNQEGNISVDAARWNDQDTPKIDLFHLVEDCIKRGHEPPLIIRFSDIIHDRVKRLNEAFHRSILEYRYDNTFQHIFPVRVCQSRDVVEEIIQYGDEYHVGLSAGSKPELLIVLASLRRRSTIVVCTGYKDSEYVETALLAQQLGQIPIIIIEKPYEIDLIIEASHRLGVKPIVGLRGKIISLDEVSRHRHIGFSVDVGEKAKFGLSPSDIMFCVNKLNENGLLDCLQMFHFNIGSQISSIASIKAAIREATQCYVQLYKLGCNMRFLDIGGGLAVDYDGSKTSTPMSLNYTVDEYAADVVVAIKDCCSKNNVPVPIIVSESGRNITSHHSVLVFNVTDAVNVHQLEAGANGFFSDSPDVPEPSADDHELCIKLYDVLRSIEPSNLQESLHDARQYKDEALALFTLGLLSLEVRAKAETLYWCCINDITECVKELKYIPEELEELRAWMSHTYYCNFSLFQSVPDSWARHFVFPVIPIHRLNEKPTVLGTLADLTCDSDGKIASFVSAARDGKTKDLLELHPLHKGEPYYIGMFLAGAYQEVLGSMHNLYGDTNIMMVEVDADNSRGYNIEHVIRGNTIDEVLRSFQYDPSSMLDMIRKKSEAALLRQELTLPQYKMLIAHYERAMRNYTYLSTDIPHSSAATSGIREFCSANDMNRSSHGPSENSSLIFGTGNGSHGGSLPPSHHNNHSIHTSGNVNISGGNILPNHILHDSLILDAAPSAGAAGTSAIVNEAGIIISPISVGVANSSLPTKQPDAEH